jgi:CDP-diacylglycerol--serine O-phosphatidyltransferase
MISQIPNILTLVNLALGGSSIILTLSGYPLLGGWFIIFAAIFDLFDGLAARLLDAGSDIGNILDSLADVISFGMAPAVVMYHVIGEIPAKIMNHPPKRG